MSVKLLQKKQQDVKQRMLGGREERLSQAVWKPTRICGFVVKGRGGSGVVCAVKAT